MPVRLEVRGLTVLRAGGKRVLSGVDLRVEPGQALWIGGESGSGKSTLLRALARLVPHAGELSLGGTAAADIAPHVWRSRVALLPQPIVPLGATLREDLLAPFLLRVRRGRGVPSEARLERELGDIGLADLELGRATTQLSQGQLARVAVLRTLLADPEVLLLDEPTANLDPEAAGRVADRVLAFVGAGGAAVVAAHADPWSGVDRHYRVSGGNLRELPG